MLRKAGLIEGREPNYYAVVQVINTTDNRAEYIHHRAFDDASYKYKILSYLGEFGSANRQELEHLICQVGSIMDPFDKASGVFLLPCLVPAACPMALAAHPGNFKRCFDARTIRFVLKRIYFINVQYKNVICSDEPNMYT